MPDVAIHQGRPGDDELAVLVGAQHHAGVGVHDPHAYAGQEATGAGLHLLRVVSHRWLATMAQVSDMP